MSIYEAVIFAFSSVLGLFIIALFRMLAVYAFPQRAQSSELGPEIDLEAPAFSYLKIDQHSASSHGEFRPGDGRRCLIFADPGCTTCETEIRKLARLRKEDAAARVLIVTTASATIVRSIPAFAESPVPVARVGTRVRNLYRAFSAPLVVCLNEDGTVGAIEHHVPSQLLDIISRKETA